MEAGGMRHETVGLRLLRGSGGSESHLDGFVSVTDEWVAEFEYGLSTQAISFKMGLDARRWESKAGG